MLKNISNLGTILNKTEQQSIHGGIRFTDAFEDPDLGKCSSSNLCGPGQICRCSDNECSAGKCEYI